MVRHCEFRRFRGTWQSQYYYLILDVMKRGGAVYIMTNEYNTTLYAGVTSDLKRRVFEHKNNFHPDSFTAKYKTYKLVYYEGFHRIEEAIGREKQIKAGTRKKKMELISKFNPKWVDLYVDVLKW